MRIISDLTNKEYATVEECLVAEKEFEESQRIEKEKIQAAAAEKARRQNEIHDLDVQIKELKIKRDELADAFFNDYGTYEYSFDIKDAPTQLVQLFMDLFD
jgi:hypothetical protein